MSEHRYWQIVNDLVATGHDEGRPKQDVREEIISQVQAAHAAGEPWAADVLMRWEREGADADYTKVHKALNSVTYIRADGKRIRKTASYSRPIREAESGEIIGQQMQAWWDYGRSELIDLRRDMAIQTRQLSQVVEALDKLIDAMDRHLECATARDAWLADGRSLDEIDLGEAGVA